MTAWKHAHLCLFVLLSLVNLSKQGCDDYFTTEKMSKYLNHSVYLIKTEELKDTLECTVERECITRDKPYCQWLDHCFDRRDLPKTVTGKCKGERSVEISHYHLGCLVSHYRATSLSEGCKNYELVCQLHRETQLIVSAGTQPSQRPPPPTTTRATLPETTTTVAAPTTTLPETTRATTTTATTTTAPTTTLPETTRATTTATTAAPATTLPETTTAAPTTTLPDTTRATTTALSPTVTQSAVSGNNANHSKSVHDAENDNTNTDLFKILLGISLIFHVIAVLGGLYMYRRWMQDRTLWLNMLAVEVNGHLPEAQLMTELRSETPPSSANREEENTLLMTDCQSIVTHSADGDSHCCAAGDDTQL